MDTPPSDMGESDMGDMPMAPPGDNEGDEGDSLPLSIFGDNPPSVGDVVKIKVTAVDAEGGTWQGEVQSRSKPMRMSAIDNAASAFKGMDKGGM